MKRFAFLAVIPMIFGLSSCGSEDGPTNYVDTGADGATQVFNVETPNGTYQCITWKNGYGGGMDCDKVTNDTQN